MSKCVYRPCLPVVRLARVRNPCPAYNMDYKTGFKHALPTLHMMCTRTHLVRTCSRAAQVNRSTRPGVAAGRHVCVCVWDAAAAAADDKIAIVMGTSTSLARVIDA